MKVICSLLALPILCLGFPSCSTPLPGLGEQPEAAGYKPYPLTSCLVTGEELESKGGSITRYYLGRELKVCCKPCLHTFKATPEVFMARMR